jgi:uncharacterized protein
MPHSPPTRGTPIRGEECVGATPPLLLLIVTGVVGGAFGAFFGLGGGVIFVPVLIYAIRMPMKAATASSLAVMPALTLASILTSLVSARQAEAAHATVSWAHALALGLPAVVGAYALGVPLASRIPGGSLKRILGAIQIAAGCHMLVTGLAAAGAPPGGAGWPLWVALPCGVLIGTLSGMLGIGGGVIAVPLLALGFGLPQHAAHITSLAVILPSVVAGTLRAHLTRAAGDLLWPYAGRMSIGALAGAGTGYLLSLRLESGTLKLAFAVMLVVLGMQMCGVFGAIPRLWRRQATGRP